MTLLARVRQQYQAMTSGAKGAKAISLRPDLAGREHIYSSYAGGVEQEMNRFADYASVYSCYAWVKKAVTVIAENIASLPVRVVDGNDKPLDSHPLTQLLANVNDEDAPAQLWRAYVVNMMLGGETFYQFVPDGRGRPAEIWMRRPDQIAVVPDATRLNYPTALEYQFLGEDNQMLLIPPEQMAHDKFYNPLSPWRGLAPIHAVREDITVDIYNQATSKRLFKNSARPDFAIVAPQGITQSEKDRVLGDFMRSHQGADKAYLPVVLEQGVTDIKTFSFPPKDIEWLQQREFSRDAVGAIFGVPDEIMGYGRDTYENFGTALEVLWTLTLLPIIRSRDTTLTRHCQKYGYGLLPGQRIDTDLSGVDVLQEDIAPKIDMAQKLWAMGVPFNALDEKFKFGLGPIEGGDVGFVASSIVPVDQAVEPPAPVPAQLLPSVGEGDNQPPAAPNDSTPGGNDAPPAPNDNPPPAKYLLPDGAKEQARRALKKLIQGIQDAHLRAIRSGGTWRAEEVDAHELYRWLGDHAADVFKAALLASDEIHGDHDSVNAAYNELKSDASLTRLLGVAAEQPFFTVSGPITPSIYAAFKSMVLELDPSDNEAEQRARMEVERIFGRDLGKAFGDQMDELIPDNATDEQLRAAVHRVDATSGGVRAILRASLEQGSSLGATVALDTLERIGMSFDWTLAHDRAAKWASQYSYDLVRGINQTTQGRLQTAVDDWFREPTTIRDLQRELEPTFGKRRARLIAQTETTRAAHEGSVAGYEQSGVVAEMEWVTVNDERVCPQCGPLDGKRASLRGNFEGGAGVPAHPGCRCFVRPVIEEPK